MRKDVAVVLCIWAKTVSCLCSVYIWLQCMYIDLIKRKIDWFTALHKHVDAQKLSCVFAMCMCMMYMSCNAYAKTLLLFCVYEQRLCHVFTMYMIAMHVNWSDKARNWSIYCIIQTCRCAKAKSCLCNICVYIVYEFNVWIKRCYCSVCDCAACKSIWKCEKSINLLHHICLYMCKSWVVSLQYMCICFIWAAACMLLSFCVYANFNALMIALLLLRFSTVCKLNMWVKRCYCSVNIDEIVQLFWQA